MTYRFDMLMNLVLSQLWQVSLVVLLVAIIVRTIGRKRPHLSYLMWTLVVLKCLTPPLWSSPTGVFSWMQAETYDVANASESPTQIDVPSETLTTPAVITASEATVVSTAPMIQDLDVETGTQTDVTQVSTNAPIEPTLPLASTSQAIALPRPSLTSSAMIVVVWAVGAAVCLLVVIFRQWLCMRAIRRSATDASRDLQSRLDDVASRLGVTRRVRLLVTSEPIGPACFGFFRPTILLPEVLIKGMCSKSLLPVGEKDRMRGEVLSRCQSNPPSPQPSPTSGRGGTSGHLSKPIDSILAHELIHFRRGDTIFGAFQLLSQIVWWFHPLVWWANRELTRERERCCDEEAVAGLACEPSEYAQTLLDVLKSKRQLKPLFAQPGVRPVDITARRLKHIMQVDRSFRERTPASAWLAGVAVAMLVLPGGALVFELGAAGPDQVEEEGTTRDWPQYGGDSQRNNVSSVKGLPTEWDVEDGKNIKWTAKLGTSVYSSPVTANGKVLIGSNNGAFYSGRFPEGTDASCLLCFDATTGDFLWQHANEKLPAGRVFDWPQIGICSTSMIEGDRVWYVNNRDEVVCLDLEGFYDNDNDGPFRDEPASALGEADVVWKTDLIGKLGVTPHNQSICSITSVGDLLLVGTSHGLDESHIKQPERAPSFIAVEKSTGKVVWQDSSPNGNLLHGQWSSPAYGVIGGVGQAIFAGGDGWLYSFDVDAIKRGKSKLLWKFDCNPKESEWILGGRGTRNNAIAIPVIHDDKVFIPVGQDPEHGDGKGHVWCIDATRRGDISPELVFNKDDPATPIPHKRVRAAEPDKGDLVKPNPNSGVVWHFDEFDHDGDGEIEIDETMHRSFSSVVIHDGLAIIPDYSGFVHCLDATNGAQLWSYDMYSSVWGTPLVADGKIYIGDEDGDVAVFRLSREFKLIAENYVGAPVYTTIMAANRTLYIPSVGRLLAIEAPSPTSSKPKDIAKSDWPSPRRDAANTGASPDVVPDKLKALWTFRTDAECEASPVIADGIAYVGDLVDSLYAIETKTGLPKWKMKNATGFAASPLVVGNRLFVGDLDGVMHCVDARVGKAIWRFNADAPIIGAANAVDGFVVFSAEDGKIFACDPKTGRLEWKTAITDQLMSSPTIAGNRVIIAGCDQQMHVLDLDSGRTVLSTDIASPTGATPAVRNGNVFVGTEDGVLFCIELATGKVRWRLEHKSMQHGIRASVAVTDDIVVVAGRGKTAIAVDVATGKMLWEFAAKARFDSAPVIVNEHVIVGSSDGRLHVISLATGAVKLVYETGSTVTGSVAVADGQIVLATDDGKVICLGDAKPNQNENRPLFTANEGSNALRIEAAGEEPLHIRSFPSGEATQFEINGRCRLTLGKGDNRIIAVADSVILQGKQGTGFDWSTAKIMLRGNALISANETELRAEAVTFDVDTRQFEISSLGSVKLPRVEDRQ